MLITETEIYWITRLDPLKNVIVGVYVLNFLFGCLIPSIVALVTDGEWRAIKKALKIGIPLLLFGWICVISNALIPTTKAMCAIKLVPLIANNASIQEVPANIADLANEWIDELRPEGEK